MQQQKAQVSALIRKEITSALASPGFYLAAVFFLVISSVYFLRIYNFAARDFASFRDYFSFFPFLYLLLVPVLTMRIWAEERSSGTMELLYTMPYRPWQLVWGKFVAGYVQFVLIHLLTIPFTLILSSLGDFDIGQIMTQYFGVFLLGFSLIALGQLVSLLTPSQISSAILSSTVLLLFLVVFDILAAMGTVLWLSGVLRYLSLSEHFSGFARGVIDSRDVLFFILSGLLFLYVNRVFLTLRKWS